MDTLDTERLREALRRTEALGYREEDIQRLRRMLREGGLWDREIVEGDLQSWMMFLRRDIARRSLRPYKLHSWRETIDFMRDVWRDDLPSILVRLNRVSPASAFSWMRGREASPSSRMRTQGFAQEVYLLRYEDDFLFRDLLIWAEDPPGSSPLETWRDRSF